MTADNLWTYLWFETIRSPNSCVLMDVDTRYFVFFNNNYNANNILLLFRYESLMNFDDADYC